MRWLQCGLFNGNTWWLPHLGGQGPRSAVLCPSVKGLLLGRWQNGCECSPIPWPGRRAFATWLQGDKPDVFDKHCIRDAGHHQSSIPAEWSSLAGPQQWFNLLLSHLPAWRSLSMKGLLLLYRKCLSCFWTTRAPILSLFFPSTHSFPWSTHTWSQSPYSSRMGLKRNKQVWLLGSNVKIWY